MASPEKEDAAAHLSSLVNTSVPSMETNYSLARVQGVAYPQVIQGERSLYRLPATGGGPATLILLIRAWPGGLPHNHAQDPFMWTSSCEMDIPPSPPPSGVPMVWCAPGTGGNMLQVLDGTEGMAAAGGSQAEAAAPRVCNWSHFRETTLWDTHARSCAAAMPRQQSGAPGGVWLCVPR